MGQFDQMAIIAYDSKNVRCEHCGQIIMNGKYKGGARPHYMSKSCRQFKKLLMAESTP